MDKKLPEQNNTNYPLAVYNQLKDIKVTEKDVLQYHQKLINHYFIKNKDHRGLLIFHGTGVGKTMLAVSIADMMKDKYRVILLSAKSLQDNFKKEIKKYMKLISKSDSEIKDSIENDYKFISSNAGNMLAQLSRLGKTQQELQFEKTLGEVVNKINLENSLVIIDEAQNLFNGIVNGSKNASGFYQAVMKATNVKLIFLSATPIINDPFEVVPLFNMLRGFKVLPEDYDQFYKHYIDTEKIRIKNKEKFKNRIFGLVSYKGDWWNTGGVVKKDEIIKRDKFPDQYPTKVEYIPMSSQQFSVYMNARDSESNVKKKRITVKNNLQKPKSDPGSTYRVLSRQVSNFLLPDNVKIKRLDRYGFEKYINKLSDKELKDLDTHSPKMKKMLENIKKHPGLCVVYSSFVTGEGLNVFSKVLLSRGWKEYNKSKKTVKSDKVFVFVTGKVQPEDRTEIIKRFNSKNNKNGDDINLMLLSGAGAEGLDLKNVRSIHIMEPYWNYARIKQIIGRAVRTYSHIDFKDPKDRTVHPYIYLSDYPKDFVFKPTKTKKFPEETTDVHLYHKSIKGKRLINKMYASMIEASIDCSLHIKKSPEEVQKKIKCLMCAPTDSKLFHKSVETDMKLDNPCKPPEEKKVKAEQLFFQDKEYYFTKNDKQNISIYEYKHNLDSYVKIDRSHPHYEVLIEKIVSN